MNNNDKSNMRVQFRWISYEDEKLMRKQQERELIKMLEKEKQKKAKRDFLFAVVIFLIYLFFTKVLF